jgi:hypothetical protein
MKKSLLVSFSTVALFLSACGGGGDSSNVDPQGIWSGPASSGVVVNAVVLETGEVWGIYSSGSEIYGALYGSAVMNGSSISIAGTDFDFAANRATPGGLSGNVVAKSTMSLSGNGITLPLTYQPSYDSSASTTAATGNWTFIGRSGSYTLTPGSFAFDRSGRFSLNQSNCLTTGSISPRPGGKNVFNLTLTTSGSGCASGLSSLSGVAYLDTSVTPNKFLALALTPTKSDGLIVIGTKQ